MKQQNGYTGRITLSSSMFVQAPVQPQGAKPAGKPQPKDKPTK